MREGVPAMNIGELISELRKDKGLLQKDLAEYLHVSVGTISNYETNVHYPDYPTLVKLADLFGVSTDYLLSRTSMRYDIKRLNEKIDNSLTVSQLINITLSLNNENKASLADFIDLLSLRNNYSNLNNKN